MTWDFKIVRELDFTTNSRDFQYNDMKKAEESGWIDAEQKHREKEEKDDEVYKVGLEEENRVKDANIWTNSKFVFENN